MSGEKLHKALLGGTECPDTAAGHWSFFSTPDAKGTSFADDDITRGDTIALDIDAHDPCLLLALIRRDEQGLNLCLTEDIDSDCSAAELLRPRPATPTHQVGTPTH
ncbi:hypothetical protein ABZ916_24915 [Streptomyces sp. NPDC046853]|uniref:hypothetical protein n=1 Tax=Streptomyces sp. NPDC046853 TaxID=3154920 RepID=UPI0033C7A9B8